MAENEGLSPQMSLPTKIEDDSINYRRINSTKKKASSVSGEKAVPHYLRASTGSCHDFCKFGHKNQSDEKLKRPIPKRFVTKPTDSHVLSDTVASLGKKKSLTMTRSLDSFSFFEPDSHSERKKRVEISSKPLKLEVSLKKEKKASVKRSASVKSEPVTSLESSGELNGRKKVTTRVASMKDAVRSLMRKQNGSKKTLSHVIMTESEDNNATSTESFETEEKTLYAVMTKSNDKSAIDFDQSGSLAQQVELDQKEADIESIAATENGDSALELDLKEADFESIVEMENGDSALELGQKEADVESIVEMENGNSALELDQKEADVESIVEMENGDSALELDQKDADVKSIVEMENRESVLELNQKEADAKSIVEMENGDYVLELDQSECVVEIGTEIDTLELDQNETFKGVVIESLPGNQSSSSLSSSSSSSSSLPQEDEEDRDEEFEQYTVSDFGDDMTLSENSEDESTDARDLSLIKAREDDKKAWKMKFRRGTVVEIRDKDNAPRRLRFRRRVDGGDDDNVTEENGSERRVVLKHQDVKEGKRDARGLFNLVIKETASKLVESRKSKVKALVGAFETVISLQDAKPSFNSVS